jgi:transposase
LNAIHLLIGQALGGEASARLAASLGMPASPDTLLRRMKSSSSPRPSVVRVLGVDDWAWKKGQRYGTILCDLEDRRVVDLLPERSTDSFAAWLRDHPEVEVISRDRGEEYTKGATAGAPQAIQVADRWHLLVNLREALMRIVDRHHAQVAKVAAEIANAQQAVQPAAINSEVLPMERLPAKPQARANEQSQNRRARRLERFETVLNLARQGMPVRAIARRLRMSRRTVRLWCRAGAFPERASRQSYSRTDPFVNFLKRRWEEGCQSATQLTKELRELGFSGSYLMVQRRVRPWRNRTAAMDSSVLKKQAGRRPSSNRVSWWLLKEPADLNPEESTFLDRLWGLCPELKGAAELAREFAGIVRNRWLASWADWLSKTQEPLVAREMRSFADGLKQDEAAVKAALALEWSNGQVEGQINRLKLLKRQMFGRAGFELLRSRVLRAA